MDELLVIYRHLCEQSGNFLSHVSRQRDDFVELQVTKV